MGKIALQILTVLDNRSFMLRGVAFAVSIWKSFGWRRFYTIYNNEISVDLSQLFKKMRFTQSIEFYREVILLLHLFINFHNHNNSYTLLDTIISITFRISHYDNNITNM